MLQQAAASVSKSKGGKEWCQAEPCTQWLGFLLMGSMEHHKKSTMDPSWDMTLTWCNQNHTESYFNILRLETNIKCCLCTTVSSSSQTWHRFSRARAALRDQTANVNGPFEHDQSKMAPAKLITISAGEEKYSHSWQFRMQKLHIRQPSKVDTRYGRPLFLQTSGPCQIRHMENRPVVVSYRCV